jgi:hypothetical protein
LAPVGGMMMSRSLTIPSLVVSLLAAPMSGALFAGTDEVATPTSAATSTPAPARLTLNGEPIAAAVPALDAPALDLQPVYYGRPPYHRNQGAVEAIFLGAAGAIVGTGVLLYANRPECGFNPNAGGCGYGTKVVGGSVLAAGVVGLIVGAALWR